MQLAKSANPSWAVVPFPNSSTMTKLRAVQPVNATAIWLRSIRKVDMLTETWRGQR